MQINILFPIIFLLNLFYHPLMILACHKYNGGYLTHIDFLLVKLFSLVLLLPLRSGTGMGIQSAWIQPPGEKNGR